MTRQIPWLRVFVEGVVIGVHPDGVGDSSPAGQRSQRFSLCSHALKQRKTDPKYVETTKFSPEVRYFSENRGSREGLCKPGIKVDVTRGTIDEKAL